jgi:glycine hydroxymethyltransferase
LIYCRYNLEGPINFSVFPGFQGGPHNHTISALAVALKEANSEPFRQYQQDVVANASRFADRFATNGHKLATGGTDNHLVLLDLRDHGVDGAKTETVLEMANISVNKNTVPGDKSAFVPGGLRMGSPAMTSRGCTAEGFELMADLVCEGVEITKDLNASIGAKKLIDFKAAISKEEPSIAALRGKVEEFAMQFPTVGYNRDTMRYPTL